MNKKERPINESLKSENQRNRVDLESRREKIKIKISEKYNISLQESERVLQKIEKKHLDAQKNNYSASFISSKKNERIKDSSDVVSVDVPEKVGSSSDVGEYATKKIDDYLDKNSDMDDNSTNQENLSDKKDIKSELSSKEKSSDNQESLDMKNKKLKRTSSNKLQEDSSQESSSSDVDEILNDIVPNYGEQVSIELKNVNLTFEIEIDSVDTIKEYVIRKLKGIESKKIILHALKDISLKIYKGEKIGIIGFNGAGKSTLLKVICGIYPPDEGQVITKGNISPLLSLGLGFNTEFSGRRNIFLNGAVLGYDKEFLEKKEQEIIDFTELGEFIDAPIKSYSSGMKAKLGFAIATAVEPDILVIDEVLGVGDAAFKRKSKDKMNYLMDGGTTVILVSHSIPQIRQLCDKAIWIDEGKIVDIGEVNKVCDHYLKAAEKASKDQLENIQMS